MVRWLVFLAASLVVNAMAMVLAPILPLFARVTVGPVDNNNAQAAEPRLPRWLGWFQTPDNSLYGDVGWRTLHCPDAYNRYWGMVRWLWRNPAYGFEWSVLAARIEPGAVVWYDGDPAVRNGPSGKEGVCCTVVANPDGSSYWHWCFVRRLGQTKCWHVNLGWKLKTYAEDPARLTVEPRAMFVFSPRISTFDPGEAA